MGHRFAIGVGMAAAAGLVIAACSSFGSDGGGTASPPDASGADAALADGAAPDAFVDPDAGCRVVIDEDFGTGYDSMPNLVTTAGGTCGVDGGELVSTSPRPSGAQAQIENDETVRGTEQRYRLSFLVKGLVPAVSGDLVRVGCTLKLLDANSQQCNVFVLVGADKLRADVDCSNSSTPSLVLLPLTGTQGDLRIGIDTLVDPAGTSFTSRFEVKDAGQMAVEPAMPLTPVKWQLKCGIDESKLVAVDGGDAGSTYEVVVDDVRLEICDR